MAGSLPRVRRSGRTCLTLPCPRRRSASGGGVRAPVPLRPCAAGCHAGHAARRCAPCWLRQSSWSPPDSPSWSSWSSCCSPNLWSRSRPRGRHHRRRTGRRYRRRCHHRCRRCRHRSSRPRLSMLRPAVALVPDRRRRCGRRRGWRRRRCGRQRAGRIVRVVVGLRCVGGRTIPPVDDRDAHWRRRQRTGRTGAAGRHGHDDVVADQIGGEADDPLIAGELHDGVGSAVRDRDDHPPGCRRHSPVFIIAAVEHDGDRTGVATR